MTWPLAAHLDTAASDLGDPILNAWIIDWDCHALLHAPLRIFDAPAFYPSKYPLAYSENMIGIALAVLPLHVFGASALTKYNVALLLGYAFSAWAGFLLARLVTRNNLAAFVAGLLYGFVPYKLEHLAHIQIIWSAWPALTFAAIVAYRRTASWRNVALLASTFVFAAITNIYFFLFTGAAAALTFVLIAVAERRDRAFWLRLAASLAIAALVLVPILRPYSEVSKTYNMRRGAGESRGASAMPLDWLMTSERSRLYGPLIDRDLVQPERGLFPGLLLPFFSLGAFLLIPRRRDDVAPAAARKPPRWLDAIIVLLALLTYFGMIVPSSGAFGTATNPAMLLTIAIVARLAIKLPRSLGEGNLRTAIASSRFPLELWIAALWIVIGVLGSFGMRTFFHNFLFHHLPGFRATRVPPRWAIIAYSGLAVWAAAAIAQLRPKRRFAALQIAALLVVLALIDVWPHVRWEHALTAQAPVDRWIASEKPGPFFLIPANRFDAIYDGLLRNTTHHQPMFNGLSGFEPPLHRELRDHTLSDNSLDLLERNGCRYVIVRPEWAGFEALAIFAWLQQHIADGRLAFVRRFDYGPSGDWVFALTHVEKNWIRFRPPPSRDGAGFTEDEELARLLDGKQTYSGVTFGRVFQPRIYSAASGPLTVAGRALSPHGIREVNVLVDNDRFRYPATLFADAATSAGYPWYPATPKPSFTVTIPKRPRGVWRYTDVQVEIVDGRGEKTLLHDIPITWR
jgi:hypothetical protein